MAESMWKIPALCRMFATELFQPLDQYLELYETFFVGRDIEANNLIARIQEITLRGGNIMVVGDKGVGKSSFLHWFLKKHASQLHNHACVVIDLKRNITGTLESLLASLHDNVTREAIQYLDEVHGRPCHELKTKLQVGEFASAYRSVVAELNSCELHKKKLLFFIDDVDYVDQAYFHELLAQLKPLLACVNTSMILAARKPAYNAVISDRDTTLRYFFEPQAKVILSPLEVDTIVRARISIFESANELADVATRMFAMVHDFGRTLAQFISLNADAGSKHVHGFPFTLLQMQYIRSISNGNIMDMLRLCRAFLEYIAEHMADLEQEEFLAPSHEPDSPVKCSRCIIGRKRLVEEFGDNDTKYGPLKIYNLHKRKSNEGLSRAYLSRKQIPQDEVGNSLYVAILEILIDFEEINETRRKYLRSLGFNDVEIDEGIQDLMKMGMLQERRLAEPRSITEPPNHPNDFELTSRGKYYVEYMIHWDAYIDKFGVSNHHKEGLGISQREIVKRSLCEFLVATCVGAATQGDGKMDAEFRVSKHALYDGFLRIARPSLIRANRTDRLSVVGFTIEKMEEMLANDWKVVKLHEIDKNAKYVVYPAAVRSISQRMNVEFDISLMYSVEQIVEFVATHCSPVLR